MFDAPPEAEPAPIQEPKIGRSTSYLIESIDRAKARVTEEFKTEARTVCDWFAKAYPNHILGIDTALMCLDFDCHIKRKSDGKTMHDQDTIFGYECGHIKRPANYTLQAKLVPLVKLREMWQSIADNGDHVISCEVKSE